MKSPCGNHVLLLLFLSFLPCLIRAASTAPPVTQPRIQILTLKFDDEEEDESPSIPPEVRVSAQKPRQEPTQLCQHNPCLEDQPPCDALAEQTKCLCPGVSGASEPPHPPRIHDLLPVKEGPDSGKVEVQWCAPSSEVTAYKVTIEGNGSPVEFKDSKRRGVVGYLEVGTKVCVEAVNRAGHSSPSDYSCQRYDPPKTYDHSLMVGVLAGGAVLFLVIVIGAVLLCKYRICQRTKRDADDGLGNPSYSAAGTL